MSTHANPPGSGTISNVDGAAPDDVVGPLDVSASFRVAAQASRALPALVAAVHSGGRRVAFTFAGQGAPWWDGLLELWSTPDAAQVFLAAAETALLDELVHLDAAGQARLTHGVEFSRWIRNPASAPPAAARTGAGLSMPMIYVVGVARALALLEGGLEPLLSQSPRHLPLVAGHSAGELAALAFSAAAGLDDGAARQDILLRFARVALHLGAALEDCAVAQAPSSLVAQAVTETGSVPGPMAAVGGLFAAELTQLMARSGEAEVVLAVQNAPTHHTLSGPPAALERFRRFLVANTRELAAKKKQGRFAGRAVEPRWNTLAVSGPFHTASCAPALERLLSSLDARGLALAPGELFLEVQHSSGVFPNNGTALRDACANIMVRPGSWMDATAGLVRHGVNTVVDVGPGEDVAHLTGSAVRGRGVAVWAAAQARQRAVVLNDRTAPALPTAWHTFAPTVFHVAGERPRLHNRFVERTGRPPVLVPGMTPTTVEAPLVVAAANAGFWAELAGGGQVTAEILRSRAQEMLPLLQPGEGYIFNALYLDPYLWNLHLGKDRTVFRLRAEGHPILGVTISAGIPPVEDAVALLDDLHAHGMTLNAFKPGTTEQIAQVLEIAKARPQFNVFVQVEGGKAGGHHSWEDLEDVIQRNYAALRALDNVVLCVGGGIGTEEQATAWLNGSWSQKLGLAPMPVDAVFLGTRLMATLEACTSPSVKAALVAAPGDVGQWPLDGKAAGGVVGGRSSLDAPLWLLDNAAARVAALLDEVAGDNAKVQARREEIIAALAGTAKPYIGDVAAMTPRDVLVRLGKLMPPARDDSWRARFVDVARRLEARFAAAAGPSLVRDDVENVAQLVEVMVVRLPQLATARMHPEDVRHFLETCRRPGKPVPFVPVLDADVRRWFKSDSLWQSHDVRFSSDAVLVIPGPAAVSAITRANEPVAHVLNDFVRHAMLDARVEPAPSPVSPLQRALALPDVRDEHNRVHPNPLVALFSGCPVALEGVTRLDGAGRTVAALAWDGQLRATLTVPNGPCLDLGLSFVADGHGGHLRWNRQAYLDAQHVFFSTAIFGEVVEPAPLFERVTQQITVDAQRVRLWCATTGTPATGSTRVPLVMAFSLAWKAIFQALAGARPDVLRLVHAGDQVEGPGFCVGETLSVTAAVTGLQTLEGGQQVTTLAQLVGDDGKVRATVTSRFFIRGSGAAVDRRAVDTRLMLGTPADVAFLKALPVVREFQEPAVPCVATLQGTISGDTLTAVMDVNGKTVGRVEAVEAGARVVDTLTQLLGERPARVALPSPVPLGTDTLDAPRTMAPYAQASGDHNPLHTNVGAAVLGGFTQPIVHGMWTASALFQRLVALTADGDHLRVTGFETTFLAPVLPGSALKMEARVVARLAGALEVHATVAAEETVVARAVMHVRQPSTGYVFPGQGVQHVGLGMESYARSPAARAVWDEADETCRARHGFSLLTVVRENPRELWVRGTRLVHPDGVLNLTQFTQVALAVAAVADVAELRDRAAFVEDALFAGHSLGEYSALAAVPRVMPLAAVVDIVYQRGLTMDRLVARDAQGRSPYAMGAMRPNLAGLTEAQALSLVVDTGAATGLPLFVVNHNVRNRQYAVTGDVAALKVLREKLLQRSTTQKPAWVDVPGIDVPFHSPLLRDGVDAFRATLDAALPKDVDAALLNHRYVPNLTGTVFRLERAFLQEVADATGSTRVKKWLDTWNDEVVSGATPAPNVLARALLIEVLAYQFASPVKWTGVQDVMFDRVQQCIEVGTARQPVLTGMARATVEQQPRHGLRVLHAALDRTAVVDLVAVVETPAVTGPVATTTAVPATVVAQASAPVNRGALPEPGAFAHDALRTLVCVLVKKSWTDVDPARSLDQLLGGNSARRNQVLAELAAELGGKAVDGAHELALQELSATVARGGGWTAPGPVLRAHQDQAIHTLFGAAGWDAARVEDTLQREWGLSPAHRARVLNRLTLGARNQTPASDASGAVAILENTVKAYASELGTDIPRQQTQAAVMTADPAALQALEARLWGPQGAFTQMARILVPEAAAKAPPRQVPSVTPLAQPEHDEAYAKACAPLFDEKRHVAFTSSWAWARRDLLDGSVPAARVARRLDACARAMALGLLDDAVKHGDAQRVTRLSEVLAPAPALTWSGKTALVTGAGEGSIARALVIRLLEQGARVVVTTTHPTAAVMRGFKVLYQAHAALGAELHVVPANQGSFSDVDALVEWVGSARRERVGSTDKGIKAPWLPDVLVPFGAMGETADLTSMGPRSLAMFRVLVLGVERLVARLAVQHQTQGGPQSRLHVLLPLSPNHGTFGGDGAYGECKAALEALLQKQHSESDGWGRSTTMVGARIGWVRGTGLMHKMTAQRHSWKAAGSRRFPPTRWRNFCFRTCSAATLRQPGLWTSPEDCPRWAPCPACWRNTVRQSCAKNSTCGA